MTNFLYRYTEGNTHLGSCFRAYNKSLPAYLHNKPDNLIKHCMQRLTLEEDVTIDDIKMIDLTQGKFLVKSQTKVDQWYNLYFWNESANSSPSYECYGWERNQLPCKHFLAIFTHISGWSYSQLPAFYTKSPFLTLDKNVMLGNVPSRSECQSNDLMFPSKDENENTCIKMELEAEASTKAQDKYKTLPLPKRHAKATAATCRNTLHKIKNMTYIISDDQTLTDLNNKLQSCPRTLQDFAPTSNGLIMEPHSQIK